MSAKVPFVVGATQFPDTQNPEYSTGSGSPDGAILYLQGKAVPDAETPIRRAGGADHRPVRRL